MEKKFGNNMNIIVSDIQEAPQVAAQGRVTHVISAVMNHEFDRVKFPGFDKNLFGEKISWKIFEMDDVLNDDDDDAPTKKQVSEILNWAKKLNQDSVLLVHCFGGVSRSTAIALSIMVQHLGIDKIEIAIEWLKEIRPQACPNPVITRFADEILGANGALFEASENLASEKLLLLRILNDIE